MHSFHAVIPSSANNGPPSCGIMVFFHPVSRFERAEVFVLHTKRQATTQSPASFPAEPKGVRL